MKRFILGPVKVSIFIQFLFIPSYLDHAGRALGHSRNAAPLANRVRPLQYQRAPATPPKLLHAEQLAMVVRNKRRLLQVRVREIPRNENIRQLRYLRIRSSGTLPRCYYIRRYSTSFYQCQRTDTNYGHDHHI